MIRHLVFLLFIFVCSSLPAFAYRPFYTEDAGVAGKGVYQLEKSWDYFKWKNGDNDQIYLLVAPIYGPTEDIELSIETPYLIHKAAGGPTTDGVGDINLVGKYVLAWENYETKDALFTIKGVVKLDTGSYVKGLGRGDTEYSLVPVFTKIINKELTVHGQLGYSWVTNTMNPNLRNYIFYGFAADYTLTEPFHIVGEYVDTENPDRTLGSQQLGLAGVTYTVNKNIILDTSYKKGLSSGSPDWGYGVGVAIQF
jgi:hypothetical protein